MVDVVQAGVVLLMFILSIAVVTAVAMRGLERLEEWVTLNYGVRIGVFVSLEIGALALGVLLAVLGPVAYAFTS